MKMANILIIKYGFFRLALFSLLFVDQFLSGLLLKKFYANININVNHNQSSTSNNNQQFNCLTCLLKNHRNTETKKKDTKNISTIYEKKQKKTRKKFIINSLNYVIFIINSVYKNSP